MKYVVFEGIDGSGKSTIAKRFCDFLQKSGKSIFFTKEPYTKEIDLLIRQKHSALTLLFLFLADRAIHMETLKQLKNIDCIVSDRSFYSTICYQSYGGGLNLKSVTNLNKMIVGDFKPDLTFYLDCEVDIAVKRINESDAIERLNRDFFERVRKGYLKLAKKYGFTVINANESTEEVFSRVIYEYGRKFKQI